MLNRHPSAFATVSRRATAALAVAALLAALPPAGRGEDWPCWRGPRHDGTSAETGWFAPWPADGPPIRWKASVGVGDASVAVAGGRVYTMGNTGGQEYVVCLDAGTGREQWRYGHPCELKPLRGDVGGPSATPAVDNGRVYAIGHQGHLVCLDATDGKVIWKLDVRKDLDAEISRYGCPASPLVEGDRLVLTLGAGGIALDKKTGRVAWRSAPGPGGYAAPVPYAVGDRRCLALFLPTSIVAVDAADGRERWRHTWRTQHDLNCADPLIVGGRVFISSGYDKGCALLEPGAGGAKVLWQSRVMRNHFGSSVVRDGYLYGFDDSVLKCLDLDGKEKWSARGTGKGALTAAAGKLIAMSSKGELIVAEASPQAFRELSRTKVIDSDGVFWTTPVLLDGLIYCRSSTGELVCRDHRASE